MGGVIERRFHVWLPHKDYTVELVNPEYKDIQVNKPPIGGYYFDISSKEIPEIIFTAKTNRLRDVRVYPSGTVPVCNFCRRQMMGSDVIIPVQELKKLTETTEYHNYINVTIPKDSWQEKSNGYHYYLTDDKKVTSEKTFFPNGSAALSATETSGSYRAVLIGHTFNPYTGNGEFYVTSYDEDIMDKDNHYFKIKIDGVECIEVGFRNDFSDNGQLSFYISHMID